MNNKDMEMLGKQPSAIRQLFEYGKNRKKIIGNDNVFDFSIGNPNVASPKEVTDNLMFLLNNVDPVFLHGYSSSSGHDFVKNAIAAYLNDTFNTNEDGKYIYLTTGAAAGLSIVIHALLNKDEEVIIFTPYWPEYKVFVDGYVGDNTYPILQQQVGLLNKFINEEVPSHSINDEALEICRKKLAQIENQPISSQDKENMRDRYNLLLKWIEAFKNISNEALLKHFDFLIVPASKFESGFKKRDLSETPIYFPECRRIYALKELINLFSLKEEERKQYFYIYYKREFGEHLDPLMVGKVISKLALE